ncbi:MAG: hypothetical protein HKO71_05125, partial [Pseudomonadales bacterium]|nr:hypothetical protein [Pseudomonadales bacterium]
NVFIISVGEGAHQVRVNNAQRNFAPGDGLNRDVFLDGVNVLRSATTTDCGFELPSSNQGCDTEKALGLEEIPGTGIFYDNVLATMQGESPLQLTSFNGTYYVNQFDIEIDSVIPLPASAIMFGSALAALLAFRHRTGSPPVTT